MSLKKRAFPTHMDIELSSKCNLRCRFCHLSYFTPKEITQLSTKDVRDRIGPFLPHLKSLTLFSKYEALTCRDFIPIFEEVSRFDIETYFSTNGLLLNDDIIDAIAGKLTYLTVSVTGFMPETYKKNMQFDGLAKVTANLHRLNARKAELGTEYPILRISTVGMLDTIDELEMAIDFAAEHRAAEGVQITFLKAMGPEMVPFMPLCDLDTFGRRAREASEYAEKLGVKFVLQSGAITDNLKETKDLGHRHCGIPWQRMSVQPNGDVYPCPVTSTTVGNMFDQTLEEIWAGDELAAFRAGVNDPENMNEDCRNCTHCRHRSIARRESNDFSEAGSYIGEMKRKTRKAKVAN